MTITATGPLAAARAALAVLLAGSATYQDRIGGDADAVRERLFWPDVERDISQHAHPFTVIEGTALKFEKVAGGGQNYLRPLGELLVIITDEDRVPDDLADSQVDFENFIGGVMADIAAVAASGDNLTVREIELTHPPAVTSARDEPVQGLLWMAGFTVRWGRV